MYTPVFYDSGETDGRDRRIQKTLSRIGMHKNASYSVLSKNRQRLEDAEGNAPKRRQSIFAEFLGGAHPKREDCAVCCGAASKDFDPFIDQESYAWQLEILQDMKFDTPQQAIDCYTFFNMLWDWRRREAVRNYFIDNYSVISEAITDIGLAFSLDIVKKRRGQPINSGENCDLEDPKLRPYCSSVYVPRLANGTIDDYGMHFVDVKLPLHSEIFTYLSQMLNPSPDFAANLVVTRKRRTASNEEARKIRSDIAKKMMPRSKSVNRIPGASPNKSSPQKNSVRRQASAPSRVNPSLKLKRTAAMTHANKEASQKRQLECDTEDPRPGRGERLKKFPELKKQFEMGFPRIILVSDSPVLEMRNDYVVKRNKKYCNVFSIKTPALPPPLDNGNRW